MILNKNKIILFLLISYSVNIFSVSDYELIISRMKDEFLEQIPKHETVMKYINEMKKDGSWSDIDYNDKSRTTWKPTLHLARILAIAGEGNRAGWESSDGKKCKRTLNNSINFWINGKFTSDNWWHNVIGAPQYICKILILSTKIISDTNEKGLINILAAQSGKQDQMTGTNRTWIAADNFVLALVTHDETLFKNCLSALVEELNITASEGLQPDWSFHQHGAMLQTGNYGNSFLSTQIDLGLRLKDTKYALNKSQISLLTNYVFEHSSWPIWNKWYDISACGRQMDYPNSLANKASGLAGQAKRLAELDTDNQKKLIEIFNRLKDGNNLNGPIGIKYWWRSDYLIERTQGWSASLKMFSTRVLNTEVNVNDENMLGVYLCDGATWFRVNGDEYNSIQPVMDWRRIPGVTGLDTEKAVTPKMSTDKKYSTSFVGAASDNNYGAAAMDFKREMLTVKKAWFFTPWGVVALGADIKYSNDEPLFTSINQTKLNGEVFVWKKTKSIFKEQIYSGNEIKAVWHNKIGYIIPDQAVVLKTDIRSGKWTNIRKLGVPMEETSLPIFLLYLKEQRNTNYHYAVYPNLSAEEFENKINYTPYKVIKNSNEQQAIEETNGNFAGIIFWKAGEINALGMNISTDKSCILIIKKSEGSIKLSISDPDQKLKEINISISGLWKGENVTSTEKGSNIMFKMPSGGFAGKSITVELRKQ